MCAVFSRSLQTEVRTLPMLFSRFDENSPQTLAVIIGWRHICRSRCWSARTTAKRWRCLRHTLITWATGMQRSRHLLITHRYMLVGYVCTRYQRRCAVVETTQRGYAICVTTQRPDGLERSSRERGPRHRLFSSLFLCRSVRHWNNSFKSCCAFHAD